MNDKLKKIILLVLIIIGILLIAYGVFNYISKNSNEKTNDYIEDNYDYGD